MSDFFNLYREAQKRGQRDYERMVPREGNPHKDDHATSQAEYWYEGWDDCRTDDVKECEKLFQNGGPKVYVRSANRGLRPSHLASRAAAIRMADEGDVVFARMRRQGSYEWIAHRKGA